MIRQVTQYYLSSISVAQNNQYKQNQMTEDKVGNCNQNTMVYKG